MLQLSGLDDESMSDERRDTFIDMAENMGLDPGDAEDIVDEYLEAVADGTFVPVVAASSPLAASRITPSVPSRSARAQGTATHARRPSAWSAPPAHRPRPPARRP